MTKIYCDEFNELEVSRLKDQKTGQSVYSLIPSRAYAKLSESEFLIFVDMLNKEASQIRNKTVEVETVSRILEDLEKQCKSCLEIKSDVQVRNICRGEFADLCSKCWNIQKRT